MIGQLKKLLLAGLFLILSWVSYNSYSYFFSNTAPKLEIRGLETDATYSGDIQCILKGSDAYKVSDITISLDGKPLVPKCRINKKEFDCPFSIPTKTLSNGKHTLLIEAQNGTFNKLQEKKEICFTVDNIPLQAAFVKSESDARIFQGRTLHVQFQVNKEIKRAQATALSKTYDCFPEATHSLIYECFIPSECEEAPNEYLLSIEIVDRVGNVLTLENKFQIVKYPFKRQTIKIDPEKIKQEKELGLPEQELEARLKELTKQSPKQKLWHGSFCAPTEIKEPKQITTQFGVIRISQEQGLNPHKAIDIYNTPKSVVWAPQNGIIVLKERFAHTGNTVIIDHGYGILSLICHLDDFGNIEVGDKIRKGFPIGTLGKTGRATGYHVHFAIFVDGTPVDPLQWLRQDFY